MLKLISKKIFSFRLKNFAYLNLYAFTVDFLSISVKQVFSDMDFLGWYTTGDSPTESDIHVHRQVLYTVQNRGFS